MKKGDGFKYDASGLLTIWVVCQTKRYKTQLKLYWCEGLYRGRSAYWIENDQILVHYDPINMVEFKAKNL